MAVSADERLAWAAVAPDPDCANHDAVLPYGCTTEHVLSAMATFADFLTTINVELGNREIPRLEHLLVPANFSSIVGEFMVTSIARVCPDLARNTYHNGHPDLLPRGIFPRDAAQHTHEGIEVKASRYLQGWQGHNPEQVWLMVFVFDSNRPRDLHEAVDPRPFRFLLVAAAELMQDDWLFAGRREGSRRTITASVTKTGHEKMMANVLYRTTDIKE